MARRSRQNDPDALRLQLIELLLNFESHLKEADLRQQVKALIPANYLMRDLGSSLMKEESAESARNRLILYLVRFVGEVVLGDELMVVGGISEYARRIRALRVEHGWSILSGVTIKEMRANAKVEDKAELIDLPEMKPDEYLLLTKEQDRDAAFRWNLANEIRKNSSLSVRDRILRYLRKNVGKMVSGEELRYVANKKSEWARRTRELRTEHGWPISTKSNGRPDLPVGTYLLERDRQMPQHDRVIKDNVRRAVLLRDNYSCQMEGCGWNHKLWNPSDPRHLEAHHIKHHSKGGSNAADNLITYCNVCHDGVHRTENSNNT